MDSMRKFVAFFKRPHRDHVIESPAFDEADPFQKAEAIDWMRKEARSTGLTKRDLIRCIKVAFPFHL